MPGRKVKNSKKQERDLIRWRGTEVGRIEAFTDAVLAFAVTLLIVSLEVPTTFDKLVEDLFGFIPFAIAFVFLFYIWGLHHEFFRRYGLADDHINALSAALIIVVLFFVYPLKFLSKFITTIISEKRLMLEPKDVPKLMIIYSCAFCAIFLILMLMYVHALKKKDELELTESEVFETKTSIYDKGIMIGMGIVSILLALLLPKAPIFSGLIYSLTGVPIGILKSRRGKIHRLRYETITEGEKPVPQDSPVK